MSLTTEDLQAIRGIVEDAIEASDLRTAAAFEDVDSRFDGLESRMDRVESDLTEVKGTVGRIEQQQRAMVEQLDGHSTRLHTIERKLKLNTA